MCISARIVYTTMAIHLSAHPADVRGDPFSAAGEHDRSQPLPIGGRGFSKQSNQHERASAFPQIAVALLAVGAIAKKVEQIVLNLEGNAEEKSEANQRI